MCNKPNIDWTKTLEVFDPDSPGRLPRPAKLLADNFRLEDGTTCKLVLIEDEDKSHVRLYYHSGTAVFPCNKELRNKTKKVVKWYNLYDDGPGNSYYESEREAVRNVAHTRSYVRSHFVLIEVPE